MVCGHVFLSSTCRLEDRGLFLHKKLLNIVKPLSQCLVKHMPGFNRNFVTGVSINITYLYLKLISMQPQGVTKNLNDRYAHDFEALHKKYGQYTRETI